MFQNVVMLLPRKVGYDDDAQIILKCSTCGYYSSEEGLNEYFVHKEINSEENRNDKNFGIAEIFQDKYPNCNERRKREYQKDIRRGGVIYNLDDYETYDD